MIKSWLCQPYTELSETQAEQLRNPDTDRFTVEVQPPRNEDLPATIPRFTRSILELQSGPLGLGNRSPISAYEIRRSKTGNVRFQYAVPTKRLERKVRTQLKTLLPRVEFQTGENGLPVSAGSSIGGGLLTLGRRDWYPLETDFDDPPVNQVTGLLHRHAMQDTSIIIQILFQPLTGEPFSRWWWKRRAYQRVGYLRKEKEKLWGSRSPTPRERNQSQAVEDKAGNTSYKASIRIAVIGAKEYVPSRLKEVSGGFNVYESWDTGQYLDLNTVNPFREKRIVSFCQAVADREFRGWSRRFRLTPEELGALVSLPDHDMENLRYSQA